MAHVVSNQSSAASQMPFQKPGDCIIQVKLNYENKHPSHKNDLKRQLAAYMFECTLKSHFVCPVTNCLFT